MMNNKYLCIEGKDMYSINYTMLCDDALNNRSLRAFTGSNCQDLFEKNDIPLSFQKVFINLNMIKMNLNKEVYGREYLTNVPISLYKNNYGDYSISGKMYGDYPGFRFTSAKYCDENEIIEFMANLKKEDLLDNYLNCLGKIFQINIITNNKLLIKNKK